MDFIVIVFDVGNHMIETYDDNVVSSTFSQALNIIRSFIQKKIFSDSKDEIALIFCGSRETKNNLNDSDRNYYKNISVIRGLSRPTLSYLEELTDGDKRVGCCGDLLESIIVAADLLVTELKGRKADGLKRVMVVSNLASKMDFSSVNDVMRCLNQKDIELNIIIDKFNYVNDYNNESDERPSTSLAGSGDSSTRFKVSKEKLENEKQILDMISKLNGVAYSFDEVLMSASLYDCCSSKKPLGWKANLEISNICEIPMVGYIKTKQAEPPQKLVLRYGGNTEAAVERRSTYHLNDGNNTPVQLADTIKGFRYGNSLVPFTEDDIKSLTLSVVKGLKLIGFCEEENVSRRLLIGDSSTIFVADGANSDIAFTALVHTMFESSVVAMVRRVTNCISLPRLAIMTPVIKRSSSYLVYSEIAFGEDIRSYTFPSLPTSSSINVNQESNKDKKPILESQLKIVDNFIDKLMLVKKDPETDKETEFYKPSKTVSPFLQLFYQCFKQKYFNPNERTPELIDSVKETLQPPMENQEGLDNYIDSIKSVFNFKNKEKESKKRKHTSQKLETEKNGSSKKITLSLDVNHPSAIGDIIDTHVTEVGLLTPVEDFQSLLTQGQVTRAIDGMQLRVWQLINDSYLSTLYPKAIVCLEELRKQVIKHSSNENHLIGDFNDFLRKMKFSLLLSSSQINFWNLLKKENITLIGQSESEFGCLDMEKESFFETRTSTTGDDDLEEMKEDEMDTLFEDM